MTTKTFFSLCISVLCCFSCHGQTDIFSVIDDDNAVVVHLTNVKDIAQILRNEAVNEELLDQLLGLAKESGLETEGNSLQELFQRFNSILDLCESINEIVVVIAEKDNEFSTVVLINTSESQIDALKLQFLPLLSAQDKDIDGHPDPELIEHFLPPNLETAQVGNWIIGSNDPEKLSTIRTRLETNSTANVPILTSRKFQRVVRSFTPGSKDCTSVARIYSNPSMARKFFPEFNDQDWELLKTDEIPSFGCQVFFHRQASFNDEISMMLSGEMVFNYTYPRSGFGKLVSIYQPLQINSIPPLPFEIFEFRAHEFDNMAMHKFKVEQYDAKGMSAEEIINKFHETDVRDYYKDILPSFSTTYTFRYMDETIGRNSSLIVQKVANPDAAKRYAVGLVEMTNRYRRDRPGDEYREYDNPFGQLFAETIREKDDSGFMPRREAIFVNDQWYMIGNLGGIVAMISAIYGDEMIDHETMELEQKEIPSETRAMKLLQDFKAKVNLGKEPIRINFYSFDTWWIVLSEMEEEYLREKHSGDHDLAYKEQASFPDQNIIRMKIESKQDLFFAAKMMVVNKIARLFGDQIVLVFDEEQQTRVQFGVYRGSQK